MCGVGAQGWWGGGVGVAGMRCAPGKGRVRAGGGEGAVGRGKVARW